MARAAPDANRGKPGEDENGEDDDDEYAEDAAEANEICVLRAARIRQSTCVFPSERPLRGRKNCAEQVHDDAADRKDDGEGEVLQVAPRDAVVKNGTVVVEREHAAVAPLAMLRAGRAVHVARLAPLETALLRDNLALPRPASNASFFEGDCDTSCIRFFVTRGSMRGERPSSSYSTR